MIILIWKRTFERKLLKLKEHYRSIQTNSHIHLHIIFQPETGNSPLPGLIATEQISSVASETEFHSEPRADNADHDPARVMTGPVWFSHHKKIPVTAVFLPSPSSSCWFLSMKLWMYCSWYLWFCQAASYRATDSWSRAPLPFQSRSQLDQGWPCKAKKQCCVHTKPMKCIWNVLHGIHCIY